MPGEEETLSVPLRADDRRALVEYLRLHGVTNVDDQRLSATIILIVREWLAGNVRSDGPVSESENPG